MKRYIPNIILVFLLILAGFGLTYGLCTRCHESLPDFLMVGTFASALWISLWSGNSFLAHYLDDKVSWTSHPIKRLIWGLAGTIGYTLFILVSLGWLFKMVSGFDLTLDADVLYSTFTITFVISTFMHGRAFLINWRQAALEAETFRKESAIARYDALKSQLNPHFLFNSLNALTNLVYEDPDKAARTIKQLSEVYRYVLDTRETELVPLANELAFVRSYLFLQQIRFGDSLKVNLELPDESGQLAPLALQLLVENAITHNVVSREASLHIRIFRDGPHLVVENNLQEKNVPKLNGTGLGLENIRRRYAFLTKEEVRIQRGPEKFSVRIPILAETS